LCFQCAHLILDGPRFRLPLRLILGEFLQPLLRCANLCFKDRE
jgi:hypothetical protein